LEATDLDDEHAPHMAGPASLPALGADMGGEKDKDIDTPGVADAQAPPHDGPHAAKCRRSGDIGKERFAFIREHKALNKGTQETKILHQEASAAWLVSDKRAQLISAYSEAERKRRRFK